MEVYDAIVSRRSVRKYQSRPVGPEQLRSLIECARLAPSGSNTQPWSFIVIRNRETRERMAKVCQQEWMLQAPVHLACVADIRTRAAGQEALVLDETSPQLDLKRIIRDTTIAIEHIVLQAESIGLATCWVAYFQQADLRPVLSIPSDKYVVALLTVGYPAEKPEPKPRRSAEEVTFYERWDNRAAP